MANNTYDDLFDQWGRALNVDPQLTKTIFHLESSGNADSRDGPQSPDATNGERAGGGMQLLPSTARAMATRLGADPNAVNIRDMKWAVPLATAYLAEGLNATGNPSDAMAYYFAGPDRNLWKSKTASYVAKGEALYPQMALQNTAPDAPAPAKEQQPQMADILDRFPMAKPAATAKPETAAPAGDILSMFPMAPAAPKKAEAPSASPVAVDDFGRSLDTQSLPTLPESVGRIGSAVRQGWESSQPILTPAGVAAVDQMGPLGRWIINPAARLAGAIPGALNALGAGTAQAVVEGANATGVPGLGRDINMGMQVAPFARMGAGMPAVRGVPEAAPTPRFIQEYYGEGQPGNPLAPAPALPAPVGAPAPPFIPPGTKAPLLPRILELLRADDQVAAGRPAVVPPDAIQPRNPLTEPAPRVVAPAVAAGNKLAPEAVAEPVGPQSVGAAASRDLSHPSVIGMTPAQELAYRSTAEGQKLLEPQQPGLRDAKQYVPGVNPSQADIEQSVNTARELKSLNITGPGVSEEAKAIAHANGEARQKHFADLAGSDVDVANAKAARSAQAEKDLAAAFSNAKDVDAKPLVDAIKSSLSDARGKQNTQLKQYVSPLLSRLVDENGNLKITDAKELYGFREDLNRMRSKASKASDPNLDHVSGEIGDLIHVADAEIEKAASGYRNYMDNYAAKSRPIDTMEVLQGHENKLYDAQNRMTYNKVQTMMRQIVDSRAAPGINPYKSIPEDVMDKLWALRDDLRRSASAQELARTPGSDTVQNTYDALKQAIAGPGAEMALHAGAQMIAGPIGNAIVATGRNLLAPYFSARSAAKRTARGMELLHPAPQIEVPPTNRLAPP